MFRLRWRLFRLLGIPVFVDASWLIILALLTLTLAGVFTGLLKAHFPEASLAPYHPWVMGLLTALAFFACILLHELGHAVVARVQGLPIRGITLFLFGGVAEMEGEPLSARAEFLMALAGPLVSAVLAFALGLLAWLGYQAGWPPPVVLVLGRSACGSGWRTSSTATTARPSRWCPTDTWRGASTPGRWRWCPARSGSGTRSAR
jgi:Zn-dependent protease